MTKKSKSVIDKRKGKTCTNCGEDYEESHGYGKYESDAFDQVPHSDMADCIKSLVSEINTLRNQLDEHKSYGNAHNRDNDYD